MVGGIGTSFNADGGNEIVSLGLGGLFISLLIIVLGAVAINAKTFISGILIIVASIFGAAYGGSLVAILMILALVGGVLACFGDNNYEQNKSEIEAPKSIMDSLIVVVCVAGLIGIFYFSKSDQSSSETPTSITIPEDTKLTAETPVADFYELAEAAPSTEAATPIDTVVPDIAEPSNETPISVSVASTETGPPADPAESPVKNMSFNDLYLDYNNLVGQKVKVEGYLMVFGDIASLTEKFSAVAVLYTETSRLSRENRKLLLDNCSSGCNVELEGVVGSVQFLKGITVTNLYKITTN